jgi:uncharacterized protein HemX
MARMSFPSLLQAFLTIVIVVVIGVGVWYVITHRVVNIQNEVGETFAKQYQGVAELYKRRMGDYEGMCTELAAKDKVVCQSNETAYRVSQSLRNGKFFCADSTGFEGVVASLPREVPLCATP